jgi:tight adherence protein C
MTTPDPFLTRIVQDPEAARLVLTLLMAAAVFVLGLVALLVLARWLDPLRRRLGSLEERRSGLPLEEMARALNRYGHLLTPSSAAERKTALDRLTAAGYRDPNRLLFYYVVRGWLLVLLPVLTMALGPLLAPQASGLHAILAASLAGLVGLIGPSYYLDKRIARRQRSLRHGFPDAIDLLVVCTEAGLGLNAALLRVADELAGIHPELAEELSIVNAEIRAGLDRQQALKNLAGRTGLEDAKGLVALIGQNMRFGSSIAGSLRIYSEEFRDRRMQKAEEEAAKLPTKMIFPLILCIWPGFFVVAIGPAILLVIAGFRSVLH